MKIFSTVSLQYNLSCSENSVLIGQFRQYEYNINKNDNASKA